MFMHARRFVQQLFDPRLTTSDYIPRGPVEGGGGLTGTCPSEFTRAVVALEGLTTKYHSHLRIQIHARTPTHVCIHIYHTSIIVSSHTRIIHTYTYYMHTQARMRAHTHPCIHTHAHTNSHAHTPKHVHTQHVCAATHTDIHTNTIEHISGITD